MEYTQEIISFGIQYNEISRNVLEIGHFDVM